MHIENCKCGSPPLKPVPVKGGRGGYKVKCSNQECPALVQRIGKEACMQAWNEMATRLFR